MGEGDRHPGEEQVSVRSSRESLEDMYPIFAVLQRTAGEYEVVGVVEAGVVVVEADLGQRVAPVGANVRHLLTVVLNSDIERQERAAQEVEEPERSEERRVGKDGR